jgi:hypothetical protein
MWHWGPWHLHSARAAGSCACSLAGSVHPKHSLGATIHPEMKHHGALVHHGNHRYPPRAQEVTTGPGASYRGR